MSYEAGPRCGVCKDYRSLMYRGKSTGRMPPVLCARPQTESGSAGAALAKLPGRKALAIPSGQTAGAGAAAPSYGAVRLRISAALGLAAAARRLAAPRGTRLARRSTSASSPMFASILSTQASWRAAVAEISAEANYRTRSRQKNTWDFGVVFISGHEGVLVSDVAAAMDAALGTCGKTIGVMVESSSGLMTDGKQSRAWPGGAPGITLLAVQMPVSSSSSATAGLQEAIPFFLGKQELIVGVSQTIMRLQSMTRVRGAQENATPRGWRQYLGVGDKQPKGILLFIDPLASKYVVQTVLDGLDLAFPLVTKFGCVCADLPPSISSLGVGLGGEFKALSAGVAGFLLPSSISLHTIVSPASTRVGPELRLTSADGQLVKEINGESPAKALEAVGREAGQLQQLLVGRSGFLLGLEAPQQMEDTRSKVWDGAESWGSSDRAASYAQLAKTAGASDWLVRSIEPLPDGRLVIRREDLRKVPPRVGPAWLRCQLHVRDDRQARKELILMLQRYLTARLFLPGLQAPLGALLCSCAASSGNNQEAGMEAEMGYKEIREVLGDKLPVASVLTHGEVGPPGIAIGGLDQKRTTRQGHTISCCLLSYEPESK